MKIFRSLVGALGMLILAARADAVPLYAASAAGAAGELYTLNPATGGVIQDVGPLNDVTGLNYGITGLAFHPLTGVLYGATHNLTTANPATLARLVTINPATARVTVIGPFNAGNPGERGATMADLAFDASGKLYGVGSVGGPQLYSINTGTGQATVIGDTGLTSTAGGGLEFRAGGLYGTPTASRFGTYDVVTGAYTNIANPAKPVGGAYGALSFDGSALYGLNIGSGSPPATHLVTIDPATGNVTDIGASLNSLDAIAFRIPEPAAMMLLVAPVLIGLFNTLRRSR